MKHSKSLFSWSLHSNGREQIIYVDTMYKAMIYVIREIKQGLESAIIYM